MGDRRGVLWTEAGLLLMVLIWGLNFVVAKWALASFDPLAFNLVRHVLASAFLLVVLLAGDGIGTPRREDLPRIVALGVAGHFFYQMTFITGLERTRAGNASLILALVPIFLLLFERAGAKNRMLAWVGALLSLLGVGLVSSSSLGLEGTRALTGDLILVGASAFWAVYTVGARPLLDRYGPIRATAWTLWIGSIGLILAGIPSLFRQDWNQVSDTAWLAAAYSGILSIGFAYLLWYRGVQHLGGARTSIFSNLTPVVAMIAGSLLLSERLTLLSAAGTVLVLGGVILVRTGSSAT
jgi:drug/metabolite transporter (DMT)-like permease